MTDYEYITNEIAELKKTNCELRDKPDSFVFSALCIKSDFYKNPARNFTGSDMIEAVVDGTEDGGVDALLTDPESENSDLVLVQSKFYQRISKEEILNALQKMLLFYDNMKNGQYNQIQPAIVNRFTQLNAETNDDSKTIFVFYTSAPKNRIRTDVIKQTVLKNRTEDFDIKICFDTEIVREIKEAKSCRSLVEGGELSLDKSNNILKYDDDNACIVNISAFSLKQLYAQNLNDVLSMNLRYYIKKKDIDNAVERTINETPETFWFKNNGLTIVCNDFHVDGKILKLTDFSIVNGGQTTTLIFQNNNINRDRDFYLPCKVIKINGDMSFSTEIAQATNSQKAINEVDLRSNTPEQIHFTESMRRCGVFYQTKRGQKIPADYRSDYLNTDLKETGKLALFGIFQMPGTGRSKPSSIFDDRYYMPVFSTDQDSTASYIKDLLYIDWYFSAIFIKTFISEHTAPDEKSIIPFANNARALCVAFVSFIARYWQNNITSDKIQRIFDYYNQSNKKDLLYDIFKNMTIEDNRIIRNLFPGTMINDDYNNLLSELFSLIINTGYCCFSSEHDNDPTLTEANFLKSDISYYKILRQSWATSLKRDTNKIKENFRV